MWTTQQRKKQQNRDLWMYLAEYFLNQNLEIMMSGFHNLNCWPCHKFYNLILTECDRPTNRYVGLNKDIFPRIKLIFQNSWRNTMNEYCTKMESGPPTPKSPPMELLMLSNALERLVARNNQLTSQYSTQTPSVDVKLDNKNFSLTAFMATRTPTIALRR